MGYMIGGRIFLLVIGGLFYLSLPAKRGNLRKAKLKKQSVS